ncbi:HAD-IIA family hydrolase [Nocardioides yefusunii]|uniref:HAD-IIA family hydrolase n=1 Tax=Nocardioides yefusunii TaxID=2500546 RepID=A0ABW1R028_9ACTN|nr:HAD-IIA family hydrolase [Nocardioides yefusunii]
MLLESLVPLVERHDLFMFDLDGVIYVGPDAVPGVPEVLRRMSAAGVGAAFVTNNAARPTAVVAEHLRELGIDCSDEDVVNSAQAAAALVAGSHPQGSKVLVVGGPGLEAAISEVGLVPTTDATDPDVVEVLTGYGPDVVWKTIMAGAARVRAGVPWTASNTDRTFPTPAGPLPGHGLLVKLIQEYSGVTPRVAGKPERPLLDATIARNSAQRPVMVGDRLDTDIEGGRNADVDTILVLTGVTGLSELVAATPRLRPHFICPTLESAFVPQGVPTRTEAGAHALGGWSARVEAGELRVEGAGSEADWWRVAAHAAWEHLDATGTPVLVHNAVPPLR